jgi:cell pole-organizing protein PopZ
MSAVNAPLPASSLDAERRAHEPSMEEILASIRRIIADDDSLPAIRDDIHRFDETTEPVTAQTRADSDEDVAEKESAKIIEPRADRWPRPVQQSVAEQPRIGADEPNIRKEWESETNLGRLAPSLRELPSAPRAPDQLHRRADNRFSDIAETSALEKTFRDEPPPSRAPTFQNFAAPAPEAAQSLVSSDAAAAVSAHFQALATSMIVNDSDLLHRYAQEMLRPLLKQWLDDNLPVLVERLVRAEIERVARGRR